MPKAAGSSKKTGSSSKSKGDEAEYAVKRILDYCVQDGEHMYLVEWKNYPGEDNWEPVENLGNAGIKLHDYWIEKALPQAGASPMKTGGRAARGAPKASGGVVKKKAATPKRAPPKKAKKQS